VDVWGERRKRIGTPELNRVVGEATSRQGPPHGKQGQPKIFYATQVSVAPPTFVFFARHANQVHFSYQRFLENRLRDAFGFDGTPIRLIFRERASDRGGRGAGAEGRGASGRSRGGPSAAHPGGRRAGAPGLKQPYGGAGPVCYAVGRSGRGAAW
jgi:hypothetical protein